MANTQYYNAPYPSANWSGEISAPQPAAHAHTTTSTTTTTTSSASAGALGAPVTTTTSTNAGAAAPSAQRPLSYPARPAPQAPAAPQSTALTAPAAPRSEFEGSSGVLDLETHQPIEVVEAPTTMSEAFLGSLKSMLTRNKGAFVTATFLLGTQGTTTWEGILHDVGNDYIIIFQPGRQRYIASDIYSLKYIEFYDTKQREICEQLLRQNGLEGL